MLLTEWAGPNLELVASTQRDPSGATHTSLQERSDDNADFLERTLQEGCGTFTPEPG